MNRSHAFTHKLHNPNFGILLIRIALGVVFLNASLMKLGDMGMTIGFFQSMGFAPWMAYFVSYVEFLAGISFILGIFTRYFAIATAIFMMVVVKVNFANGFSLMNGGYEYVLVLALASISLVNFGSGKYSLANCIKKNKA